ncbi:MAG: Fur family transcriptional regulator [Sphaerochaetaceae bacterium]
MAMFQQNQQVSTLKAHGIRPLNHRVAVLEYLHDNPTHPTADDIYNGLKDTMASISRTTVYNVLHLLVEKGVVMPVTIDSKEMRYDARTTPHIHFKCLKCGKVTDILDVEIPSVAIGDDFDITRKVLFLEGICPECKKHS